MAKVIVLGAGVGGLTAAHELLEKGHQVVVYELGGIPGGKSRSYTISNNDVGDDMPAEHGFRFFPGFYRHINETMAKIPYAGNANGVLDNLVATTTIALDQEGLPPFKFPSTAPQTVAEWFLALKQLLNNPDLGLTDDDRAFFAKRLLCILGSGHKRREEQYDAEAWWDFVDANARSAEFQKFCARGLTRSLVAMRSEVSSTYTVGNILVQMVIDIMTTNRPSDRVLNGPTNEVWIEPWVRELVRIGNFDIHYLSEVTQVHINGAQISHVTINGTDDDSADYYVCALPVEVTRTLLSNAIKNAAGISEIDNLNVAWMNGVLFYLNKDVSANYGHFHYADSPWALTSICQGQFWSPNKPANYGNGNSVDILSAIVSEWDVPGNQVVFETARNTADEDELLLGAWEQIKAHRLGDPGEVADADLVHSHLDEAIDYQAGISNAEPLLINTTNSWDKRPQAITGIPNLFLASDYVQTNTNLATMEAANEAAKRAVNGILTAEAQVPDVVIFELDEPAIFKPLQALDDIQYNLNPGDPEPWLCKALSQLPNSPSVLRLQALDELVDQQVTQSSGGSAGFVNTSQSLLRIVVILGILILIALIILLAILL